MLKTIDLIIFLNKTSKSSHQTLSICLTIIIYLKKIKQEKLVTKLYVFFLI